MFDDLKQNDLDPKASNQPTQNNQSNLGGVQSVNNNPPQPTAAKKTGIEDMFNDIDPVADKKAAAELQSALQSGKIKPVSNTSDPQQVMPPSALDIDSSVVGDRQNPVKKIAAIVISILLLAAVATGVYYFMINNPDNVIDNPEVLVDNTQEEEEVSEQPQPQPEPEPEPIIEEEVDEGELDDDGDNLTNAEEAELGTNPREPDTDNDGVWDFQEVELYFSDPLSSDSDEDDLSDYDEIFIWGTDPNDVDTDGDGYGDGVEVDGGYNPYGPGDMSEFVAPDQREIINY